MIFKYGACSYFEQAFNQVIIMIQKEAALQIKVLASLSTDILPKCWSAVYHKLIQLKCSVTN